ncbi:Hypothetical predicted protein, partial [Olea europaea subsp. europaea]|uniref:Complex 1 LYR protein domain-containing protein n=1 Tax=Olea europaea subsp. europaea TaxID=158383 RepID=A0A8S0PYC9_OLEEU
MASLPARSEVLSLYRSLLRMAREYTDDNMRKYVKRRTIDAFRHNYHLSDPSATAAAFTDGKSHLGVAMRQAVVYSLYATRVTSVMEINHR